MKILEFSFEEPSKWYGGGICVGQSVISLSSDHQLTFIGPAYDKQEYPQIKLEGQTVLRDNNGVVTKAINLFRGVTTRYFQEWQRAVQHLDPSAYDAAFMDFTYNDFIVKWAHKHGLKIAARVHNIEADMIDASVRGSVHDKYWVRNVLNGWLIKKRERYVMTHCDHLIFLTLEDQRRACELYGEQIKERSSIIPICMYANSKEHRDTEVPKPYILATGSLYYGPNAEGIKWFVKNVWSKLQADHACPEHHLVVAGRNPDKEMKEIIKDAGNCILVESPEDIYPYYQNADLYVAPIFYGAGMKVKVAEAMSYGLTVVGSHHALIGYEETTDFCMEANTAEEYAAAIRAYLGKKQIDRAACIENFKKYYSMQRSIDSYNQVAKKIAR